MRALLFLGYEMRSVRIQCRFLWLRRVMSTKFASEMAPDIDIDRQIRAVFLVDLGLAKLYRSTGREGVIMYDITQCGG